MSDTLKIGTYNVLCQRYYNAFRNKQARDQLEVGKKAKITHPTHLQFPARLQRLREELLSADCDVLCLQEIETTKLRSYEATLRAIGYDVCRFVARDVDD